MHRTELTISSTEHLCPIHNISRGRLKQALTKCYSKVLSDRLLNCTPSLAETEEIDNREAAFAKTFVVTSIKDLLKNYPHWRNPTSTTVRNKTLIYLLCACAFWFIFQSRGNLTARLIASDLCRSMHERLRVLP